jgi:hypothetical protein
MSREQENLIEEISQNSEEDSKNLRMFFHGVIYQILVFILCIFNLNENHKDYGIFIEKNKVKKFDDIVFEFTENGKTIVTHVQATHTQDKNPRKKFIEGKNVLSNEKLGIGTYFEPLLDICDKNGKEKVLKVCCYPKLSFQSLNSI